jgi:hypothetical protein
MLKRVTWFVAGAATGAVGTAAATRKVKRTVAQLSPENLARRSVGAAKAQAHHVAEAVREGRAAMRNKEQELRERLGLATAHADQTDVIDMTERARHRADTGTVPRRPR